MTPDSDAQQGEKISVHVDADLKELVPGYLENRHADAKAMLEALEQGGYEAIRTWVGQLATYLERVQIV